MLSLLVFNDGSCVGSSSRQKNGNLLDDVSATATIATQTMLVVMLWMVMVVVVTVVVTVMMVMLIMKTVMWAMMAEL